MEVPFGRGTLAFEVSPGLTARVLQPPAVEGRPLDEAVERALAAPVGGPPLADLVAGARDVVLAVPDATRPLAVGAVLPVLLRALTAAGVPPGRVTVVAALGLHRPLTDPERAAVLGTAAGSGVRLVDHDATTDLVDLGRGPAGVPLVASRHVARAGVLLALGCLEPHQYAGFSGGWKTVGVGCAGEAFIAATHAPALLGDPACAPGVVDGNPFLAAVRANGRAAGLRWTLNVVPDRDGGAVAAAAGDPDAVFAALVPEARQAFTVDAGPEADVVVAGVGAPKDANLYQATRAVTNLVCGARPVVRTGGTIILPAPCPEGVGEGAGERRFAARLREGAAAVLAGSARPFRGGEQRAWVVARALRHARVVVVGSAIAPDDLAALGFGASPDIPTALTQAAAKGARNLLVVPEALHTLIRRGLAP